jgi:hypothetical protein
VRAGRASENQQSDNCQTGYECPHSRNLQRSATSAMGPLRLVR